MWWRPELAADLSCRFFAPLQNSVLCSEEWRLGKTTILWDVRAFLYQDHQPQWEHSVTSWPCGSPSHSWLFLLLFRQSYTHSALLPSALGTPSSHPLFIHASFPCPSSFLFSLFLLTFHLLSLKLPSNSFLVFSGSPVPPLHSPGPTTAPSSRRQALPCPGTAVGTLFMSQIPSFLRLCGSWGLGTASSWQAEVIGVEMRWSSCSVLNTDCQSRHNRWWF